MKKKKHFWKKNFYFGKKRVSPNAETSSKKEYEVVKCHRYRLIEWRFNVSGLEAAYANFLGGLYLPDDAVIPSEVPVLILRGADSNYVPNTANRELASLFSALSVITVKNAGHWLHQEQTETVLTMVRRHFAP